MKWIILALAFFMTAAAQAADPLRIVIIGDSTVCEYPEDAPTRGWGHYIEERFDGVKVINLAKSGRSTKTFIKEGLWKKALEEKPDLVLVQFGHNDSHGAGKPESTDAETDYKDYLRKYVDEARGAGSGVVLVTPMHRRTFDREGKLADSLGPYANAMKQVGSEKEVPVIDLHASSGRLFAELGDEKCKELANAPADRTHFNEKGARAMADLVMRELPKAWPPLEGRLKK